MNKNNISILFNPENSISLYYTLYPIFLSKYSRNFDFYSDANEILTVDKNSVLIILGKFVTKLDSIKRFEFLSDLKIKYKHLIFLDDLDGSEIQFFEFFEFFDLYFKKQVYSNKTTYLKGLNGNKLFSDFYSKKMGMEISKSSNFNGQFKGKLEDLDKIKISWNLGLGPFNVKNPKIIRLVFNNLGPNFIKFFIMKLQQKKSFKDRSLNKCQARFSFNPIRGHVDFQRKLFLEIISDNQAFLSGKITLKKYREELQNVQAVLSPFGHGEICFRDFEAIINGAALIKPDMNHIETWPKIFNPYDTYLPIKWDGSDLLHNVDNLLSNPNMSNDLRQNAYINLSEAHRNIDNKIMEFIDSIKSLK